MTSLGNMADIFDVIADPTRRDILRVLLDRNTEATHSVGEISVSEIVATLELSQPTVSKHLKTLREFSIVSVREQGQHRYYRLQPASLEPLAEWLGAFIKPAVATGEPVSEDAQEVVRLAPVYPLTPRARGAAVRIGATAAAVVGRLRH